MNIREKYDLVIIGGGPAGLSAAISILQKMRISVLVVDKQSQDEERIGESCPPDTITLLEKMGLRNAFYSGSHTTCPGYASVWGKPSVGYNDFIVNPLGPSWCLNRKEFDHMLATEAIKLGAELTRSTRFINARKIAQYRDGYELRLHNTLKNDEFSVTARFVVDATGSGAKFAREIGVKKWVEDRLVAVVRIADVSAGEITKQVQLEATATGWWYSTLLPEQRIVTMAISEKETAQKFRNMQNQLFEENLACTKFISNNLTPLSLKNCSYFTWPVISGFLTQIEGRDWMAIGDAASSYDPIASQGIYKGLSEGILSSRRLLNYFGKNHNDQISFSEDVKKRYKIYQRNRNHVYMLEQRWSDSPFWLNRHSTASRTAG